MTARSRHRLHRRVYNVRRPNYVWHIDWRITFFKDFRDQGHFDASISYYVEASRFSFMGLLQSDLDETRELWNNHSIREV